MSPMPIPQATANGMASALLVGPHPAAAVDIMPPMVTTQGIERSMWPRRTTSMTPVAMMPRNEATWSCCRR